MLIENTEVFKEWLTKQLEPICDADPVALAKYVVALVKKDKPVEELADNCNDQLQVFLQDKTDDFVKLLFSVLESKDYLKTGEAAAAGEATPAESSDKPASQDEPAAQSTANQENEHGRDERDRRRRMSPDRDDRDRRRSPLRERRSPPYRRSIADRLGRRDDRRGGRRFDDRSTRRPAPYWDRDRQRRFHDDRGSDRRAGDDDRSRPGDDDRPAERDRRDYRGRRSRSPGRRGASPAGKSPAKDKSPGKDKSPAKDSAEKEGETAEAEDASAAKARGKSPSDHISARDRAEREFRSLSRRRSRSRSVGRGRPRSASNRRSRSRSWSPRSRSRSRSRSFPRRRSRSRGSRDRDRYPHSTRQRCRDFEEKGYCMQGDYCPYDHGLDPVVVEDINLPLPYGGPPGLPPPGPPHLGPPPHNLPPTGPPPPVPSMPPRGPPPPHMPPHDMRFPPPQMAPPVRMGPPADTPYNPEAPGLGGPPPPFWRPPGPAGAPMGAPPEGAPPYNQPMAMAPRRDLVTVQTVPSNVAPVGDQRHVIATNRPMPPFIKNGSQQQHHFGHGRGRGRGGYQRTTGARHDYSNTTLEVRKIPPDMNNIAKLNEHFAKFGTLVNVQIAFDGDREAALVSFSTNKEASDAYRSSDPVFNNRFIKVFWHKAEDADKSATSSSTTTSTTTPSTSTKSEIPPPEKMSLNNALKRQQQQQLEEQDKVMVNALSSGAITKTLYNTQVINKKMAAISANRANDPQKKKEDVIKKKQEIQKQKQELLKKLLTEQKGLLDRMDKNKATMSAEEKAGLLATIKSVATQIEKMKKEITAYQANQPKQPVVVRTKQEAQKQILDTELELMAKEGAQTSETVQLRKRLADLKREAQNLGLPVGRGRGRGGMRGGYALRGGRGAMRGGRAPSMSVDRRPKSLAVTIGEEHNRDELTKHFAYYGELESAEFPSETEMIVTYKTRNDAESALRSAGHFRKQTLALAWHRPGAPATNAPPAAPEAGARTVELAAGAEVAPADSDDDEDDDEEEYSHLDEELLLGGDDMDDDDSIDGERSWRR